MKTKLFPYALIAAFVALSAIFIIPGCQKSVGPFDPSGATYMYTLRGQVVDGQTNAGIPSATVKVFNKVYTTDINGYFTFKVSYATTFPFQVTASAPEYVLGNSVITGPTQVRAIRLTMKKPDIVLTETGGTVVAPSAEGISNKPFELNIPAGALAQETGLSLTPMEEFYYLYGNVQGLEKGGVNLLDLGTISIWPYGLNFLKPVKLYIPLPFSNSQGSTFPVLRYDEVNGIWVNTQAELLVDAAGTGGYVELTQGGIYSVAGQGTFTEQKDSESPLYNYSCQGDKPFIWQAIVEHPAGTGEGINATWLKNIVSHNTILGGHVSFLKETYTHVVCDTYQPGSSYPVPSDDIRLPSIIQCPSGTSPILLDKGVAINKRMISAELSVTSYENGAPVVDNIPLVATIQIAIHTYAWQCLHDQGGGKK